MVAANRALRAVRQRDPEQRTFSTFRTFSTARSARSAHSAQGTVCECMWSVLVAVLVAGGSGVGALVRTRGGRKGRAAASSRAPSAASGRSRCGRARRNASCRTAQRADAHDLPVRLADATRRGGDVRRTRRRRSSSICTCTPGSRCHASGRPAPRRPAAAPSRQTSFAGRKKS